MTSITPAHAVHDFLGEDDDDEQEKVYNTYREKWNCNLMRRKIQEFLATKEMSQTKFLETIGGVNSNSFGRFMKLKGPYSGCDNGTYSGTVRFFMMREMTKKAAKQAESSVDKKRKRQEGALEKSSKKSAIDALLNDISSVVLPPLPPPLTTTPSWTDSLFKYHDHAVLESCDDVRKCALAFIAENSITTAHFLRIIGDVNQKSWNSFLDCRGPGADVLKQPGAGNSTYYKAYYFLEKVRIAKQLPKSAKRVAFESQHPRGYSLKHDDGMRWVQG